MAMLDNTPELCCVGFTKRDYFITGSEIFIHCTMYEVTLKDGIVLPPNLYLETFAAAEMADIVEALP